MQGCTPEHGAPVLPGSLLGEPSLGCAHRRAEHGAAPGSRRTARSPPGCPAEQAGQGADEQLLGYQCSPVKRGAAAAEQQEQPLRKAAARNPVGLFFSTVTWKRPEDLKRRCQL